MRRPVLALSFAAAMLAPSPARAGGFGGFSGDGATFLAGNDQVCKPLVVTAVDTAAAPVCARGEVRDIAAAKYRKGDRQTAATGYRASGRGTRIELFAPGQQEPVVRWNAGGVVSRIVAVYAIDDGAVVAVEFQSRRFGRAETDAVAFRLRAAAPDPEQPPPLDDEQAAKAVGLRGQADELAHKKKWKAAEKAYRDALAVDDTDVAARYGLAVALASRNKLNEAVRELRAIAKSTRDDAIVWLVEARTDKAFRKLHKNQDFRRAVGLEREPGAQLTAYERLLEPRSGWEQTRIACEQAGVRMKLDRKDHTFGIKITVECQGYDETVRLDGSWQTQGGQYLMLTFPNVDGPDETTRCEVRTCDDGSGEDCVSCQVDADLGFVLRPVKR